MVYAALRCSQWETIIAVSWKKSLLSSRKPWEVPFLMVWKSIGNLVGSLLKPSWVPLSLHHPLSERAGWGWQMDQAGSPAQHRKAGWCCLGGTKSSIRGWGYSTFSVPGPALSVSLPSSTSLLFVYTFRFVSLSSWRPHYFTRAVITEE